MTLREVLQIEIWSKRTTRRLLTGVWFAFAGLVLTIISGVISGSWVTPLEKGAIQNALTEIEKVRQFKEIEGDAYQAQVTRASSAIGVCEKREISEYDEQIVPLLALDLQSAVDEKKAWQLPDSSPRKQLALKVEADVDRVTEQVIRNAIR